MAKVNWHSHTYNIIQFCGEKSFSTTPSGGSTILYA
jgi:hypothetical protein